MAQNQDEQKAQEAQPDGEPFLAGTAFLALRSNFSSDSIVLYLHKSGACQNEGLDLVLSGVQGTLGCRGPKVSL